MKNWQYWRGLTMYRGVLEGTKNTEKLINMVFVRNYKGHGVITKKAEGGLN